MVAVRWSKDSLAWYLFFSDECDVDVACEVAVVFGWCFFSRQDASLLSGFRLRCLWLLLFATCWWWCCPAAGVFYPCCRFFFSVLAFSCWWPDGWLCASLSCSFVVQFLLDDGGDSGILLKSLPTWNYMSLILYTIMHFGQAGCWDFKSALQWLLFSAERKPDFILGRPSALAPISLQSL